MDKVQEECEDKSREKLETSLGLNSGLYPTGLDSPVIKMRKLPSIKEIMGTRRLIEIADDPVAKRRAIDFVHKINVERQLIKKRGLEEMRRLDERVFRHVEESRLRCEQMVLERKLNHKSRILERMERDKARKEEFQAKQQESRKFVQRLLTRGRSVNIDRKLPPEPLPLTPQLLPKPY
jgi:hypothetical protein